MRRLLAALLCLGLLLPALGGGVQGAIGVIGATAAPALSTDGEEERSQEEEESKHYDPNISLTVRYDYDNKIRFGAALPAFVTIENRGLALEAMLRMTVTSLDSYDNRASVYEMPVSLGENATGAFTLPFAVYSYSNVKLQLVQGDTAVAGARTGHNMVQFSTEMLVGVLSDNPEDLGYWLEEIVLVHGEDHDISLVGVALGEGDFPEEFYYMDRFALIVLNHFDVQRLNEAQRRALFDWVRGGGRLLVDGDPAGAHALSSLSELVSLETAAAPPVEGHFRAAHYYDEGFIDTRASFDNLGQVSPRGEVLADMEGFPLVMAYPAGQGKVFVTAFALGDAQMQLGNNRRIFSYIPDMSALNGQQTAAGYGSMEIIPQISGVTSIEWLDAPDVGWIIPMLAVFIVVAGPVSYALLARWDKRELIWLTAPALAILCCAVIVISGGLNRGSELVSSVITVVDGRESTNAPSYSTVGVGAPKRGSYEVQVGEEAFPLAAYSTQSYYLSSSYYAEDSRDGEAAQLFRVQGRPGVTFRQLEQWDMETFMLRRQMDVGQGLFAALSYLDGAIHYQLRNDTGTDLEDVTLVYSEGYVRLPLLEAGEEATGTLTPYAALAAGSGYSRMIDYWTLCNELYGGPQGSSAYYYSGGVAPDDDRSLEEKRLDYLKGNMMQTLLAQSQMYSSDYYSGVSGAVWGWSSELGALSLESGGAPLRNDLNLTLVMNDARLDFEKEGSFYLPLWQIFGKASESSGEGGEVMEGSQYAYITKGEVVFDFQLPEGVANYTLDSLRISANYINGDYQAKLYNYSSGRWDEYKVNSTMKESVNDYVSPGSQAGAALASPTGADSALDPGETSGAEAAGSAQTGRVRLKLIAGVKASEEADGEGDGEEEMGEEDTEAVQTAATGELAVAVEETMPDLNVDNLTIAVSGKER